MNACAPQLVATGKKHAGVLANSEALERRAVQAGLRSGDLCFPLLYAPELLFPEFKSEVAPPSSAPSPFGCVCF